MVKKRENKWIKRVARNWYPLQAIALEEQKIEGLSLGKLHWAIVDDLVIKADTSLCYLFASSDPKARHTNVLDFFNYANKDLERALKIAIDEIEKNLNVLPGDKLLDVHKIYKKFKKSFGLMALASNWLGIVEREIQNSINVDRWEMMIDSSLQPFKKTAVVRENDGIIAARKKYLQSRDQSVLSLEAKKLAKKFGYIHSEFRAKEWFVEDYIKEIKDKKSVSIVKADKKINLKLSDQELWLRSIIQKIIYIYDEGKSVVVRTSWALRKTIINLGYDEVNVFCCTEEEFISWVKGGRLPDAAKILSRDKYFSILVKNGKLKLCLTESTVKDSIKAENITEFFPVAEKIYVLKGNVAWRGVTRGRVRILYTQSDASKFKEGEILVASMTTPELISAMRIAAAFVTDEGGITSHAAIVAREFKKPCITATKNATKVFKNGDLVEVDADNGVIKLINR